MRCLLCLLRRSRAAQRPLGDAAGVWTLTRRRAGTVLAHPPRAPRPACGELVSHWQPEDGRALCQGCPVELCPDCVPVGAPVRGVLSALAEARHADELAGLSRTVLRALPAGWWRQREQVAVALSAVKDLVSRQVVTSAELALFGGAFCGSPQAGLDLLTGALPERSAAIDELLAADGEQPAGSLGLLTVAVPDYLELLAVCGSLSADVAGRVAVLPLLARTVLCGGGGARPAALLELPAPAALMLARSSGGPFDVLDDMTGPTQRVLVRLWTPSSSGPFQEAALALDAARAVTAAPLPPAAGH